MLCEEHILKKIYKVKKCRGVVDGSFDFCWHLDSKNFLVDKKYKSHQKFEVFFIVMEEYHILSEQKLLKPLVIWSESVCSKHVAYSIASTHSPQIVLAFSGGNALASLMQLEQSCSALCVWYRNQHVVWLEWNLEVSDKAQNNAALTGCR